MGAVLSFDKSKSGLRRAFDNLNLKFDYKTVTASVSRNKRRVSNMGRNDTTRVMKQMVQLRGITKGWLDKEREQKTGKSSSSF